MNKRERAKVAAGVNSNLHQARAHIRHAVRLLATEAGDAASTDARGLDLNQCVTANAALVEALNAVNHPGLSESSKAGPKVKTFGARRDRD